LKPFIAGLVIRLSIYSWLLKPLWDDANVKHYPVSVLQEAVG